MGQPYGPIYGGTILGDLHFQPVLMYILDGILVLPCPLTVDDVHILGENYTSYMVKHIGTWEVLYLIPKVVLYLIN